MDSSAILDAVVRLRLAISRAHDRELRNELREVEVRLRRQLGPHVPKGRAARLLGVSVTALDRWIDRGYLPVVAPTADAQRLAVETGPLLDLATEVQRIRSLGRKGGVIAAAVRALHWPERGRRIVYSADIARLPRPNVSLDELQRQYAETTPLERVLHTAELNRSLSFLQRGVGG